jgi:hypothetical protein
LEVSASYTPDKHCININDLVIDKIYRFTLAERSDDEAYPLRWRTIRVMGLKVYL